MAKSCECSRRDYNEQWDAYFCKDCYRWLEEPCSDHECEYCKDRPKKAPKHKDES